MASAAPSFDLLIEQTETLDTLLDDGPGDDSAAFLTDVQEAAAALEATAKALTVDDVDAEFTEDDEDESEGN